MGGVWVLRASKSPNKKVSIFDVKDKIKFLILLTLRVHHWMDALDQGPARKASPTGSVSHYSAHAPTLGNSLPPATALAAPGFLPRQELPACAL